MPLPVILRLVGDVLCVVLCLLSAISDARDRRIPDYLTLPALGLGLILAGVAAGGYGVGGALMGAVLLGGLFALFAAAGGLGWGDVKLMGAVGALLGWPLASWSLVLYALLYTALTGGALAVLVAALQRRLGLALRATASLPRGAQQRLRSGVTIPYGVAIGVGTVWAVVGRYVPQLLIG